MVRSESDESHSLPVGDGVSALILAGGMGLRMGGRPKALLRAGGETLLERAVRQAGGHAAEVIVGLPEELVATGRMTLGQRATVVVGGLTRQATFRNTLERSTGEIVVVHDVARPFASDRLWASVIGHAREHGAAAPALAFRARDSLAMRDGTFLGAPVERESIVSIQTPYAFRRLVLDRALSTVDRAGWEETSVATLVSKSGEPVFLVPGEEANAKVTFEEDWHRAEAKISASQRATTRAARSRTREL